LLGQEQSAPLQVASTTPSNSPPTVISRETQLNDSSIGVILIAVESGHKFPEQVLKGLSPESRSLHQQWDSLQVKHGKLWRKFFLYDGTVSCLQLVVPHSLRNQVLRELHDSPVGGHLGQDKVIGKLQQRFYWPGSITDAKHWCNTCPSCAARKTHPPRQQAPLNTITTGTPMQTVAVDILGPLPQTSSGNRYILVAMDYFTRWAEAYAIQNQEATTVADKLVSNFFLRFSPPEQLHSDQGRQFESSLLHEVCRSLGIHKTRTTPYHPQGDGLVERFNRTLLNMLATTAEDHPATWETLLPKLCMAYNTSIQASTGYTPFYLMFGREARLPVDLMFGPSPTDTTSPNEYTAQLQLSLREAYQRVRTNLTTAHNRQKDYYDQRIHGRPIQPGNLVWLLSPAVPVGHSRKLHCPWTGPYEVLQKLSDCTYKIQSRDGKSRLCTSID
jgi:transposase InsO family protein